MPTHAIALFAARHASHAAVEQLVQAGFPRDAISIVLSESTYEREFGGASVEQSGIRATRTGVLSTIVSGLVVLPSPRGPLRAAGPLIGTFRRSSEGVAPGDFIAGFEGDGLGEHERRFLQERVFDGHILIGVQATGDRMRLATQLLELAGGTHASSLPGVEASTARTGT